MYHSRARKLQIGVLAVNILAMIAYLLVCLVPFVNTGSNWFVAVPGIVFPVLLAVLLVFALVWLFMRSKWGWVCVAVILTGIQQIRAVFAFHLKKEFSYEKAPDAIRVFQWNVMGWNEFADKQLIEAGGHPLRPRMLSAIQDVDADILCLEEFFEPADSTGPQSNNKALRAMGFPYSVFVPAKNISGDSSWGIAIFSKYPFVDSGRFELDRYKEGDYLVYADIKINGQVIRVFAAHLYAIKFAQWEENSRYYGATGFGRLFNRLVKGYEYRYYQAENAGRVVAQSPYPVIICGDFNDIPNSSTYFNMRGSLQDAFLEKGYGFGRTTAAGFALAAPRIDYILADKKFTVSQFAVLREKLSDHFSLVTDVTIKKQ